MRDRLLDEVLLLFVLAIPVACVAWTVTHEEVCREPREYCARRSREAPTLLVRKFFYLFTCEYCFSHYVAAACVAATGYRLLLPDWRGYVLGWFAVVWIANQYMSLYGRLRLDIKAERVEVGLKEDLMRARAHGRGEWGHDEDAHTPPHDTPGRHPRSDGHDVHRLGA